MLLAPREKDVMRKVIRWGIIGCGNVTEVKSGPGFQLAARSQLVAVMRRRADLAEDYARRHGVGRWTTSAHDLIHDPGVDAVYVATPVGDHYAMAMAVCEAGKPCYVEKPMARNHAECREMVRAFEARKIPLFVAYYRRCLPRFMKVRDLVRGGTLGRGLNVSYQFSSPARTGLNRESLPWRLSAAASGGGLFLDLGSHTLDILDFILGPLQFVKGSAQRRGTEYDVEDLVDLEFSAQQGSVCGHANWDFRDSQSKDLMVFEGEEGRVSLSTFGNEPVRVERSSGEAEELVLPNPPHIQQPLIQTIVDELLGMGHCPSRGESAARTSQMMDSALEAYYGGRGDSFWLRPETWAKPE